jgi:predicted permease
MVLMSLVVSLTVLGLIMVLGIASRAWNFFSSTDAKVLGSFVYYFSLPALFLTKISGLDLSQVDWMLFFYVFLPQAAVFFALLVLHSLGILKKGLFILLGLSVVFGSYAFFGVPFFFALYGEPFSQVVVLTAGLLSIYGISASISLFEYAKHGGDLWASLRRIVVSPLMLSLLGGLVCSLLNIRLGVMQQGLELLALAASPVSIFMLGMFVYDNFSLRMIRKVLGVVIFRALALPLATFLFLLFLDPVHSFEVKQLIFLHSGIPVAVSVAVMAQKYEYRAAEITAFVVVSSLLSFPLLAGLFLWRLL